MSDSKNKLLELFIKWSKRENTNYTCDWVYTKNSVYKDGVDVTCEYLQWMEIKLRKGDTSWLEEMNV